MKMRSFGMVLAAPALGCAVVACGSGTSPVQQTATPVNTVAPTATPSALSLPSDPCHWLLESDAQQVLGFAINTRMDDLKNCSYTPGTAEETASPSPGAADSVSVDILDSTSFAAGEVPLQPDGVTYSIVFAPSANVIPGSSGDTTFYALGEGSPAHPAWNYLYVQVGTDVSFRVGLLAPSWSASELESKDQAAALDVLRNLNLH